MTSAYISTLIGIIRNECRLDDVLRQARGSLAMDSDLATRWAKDHRTRNQNSPRISIEDRNGDDVYTDTCPAGTIWTTEPMLPNMTRFTASQKTVELYRRYQDMDSTIKALEKIAGILKKDGAHPRDRPVPRQDRRGHQGPQAGTRRPLDGDARAGRPAHGRGRKPEHPDGGVT